MISIPKVSGMNYIDVVSVSFVTDQKYKEYDIQSYQIFLYLGALVLVKWYKLYQKINSFFY